MEVDSVGALLQPLFMGREEEQESSGDEKLDAVDSAAEEADSSGGDDNGSSGGADEGEDDGEDEGEMEAGESVADPKARNFYRPNAAVAALLDPSSPVVVVTTRMLLDADPGLASFASALGIFKTLRRKAEWQDGHLRLKASGLIIPLREPAATAAAVLAFHVDGGRHLSMEESLARVQSHVAAQQDGGPSTRQLRSILSSGCHCLAAAADEALWAEFAAEPDTFMCLLEVLVGAPLVVRTSALQERRKLAQGVILAGTQSAPYFAYHISCSSLIMSRVSSASFAFAFRWAAGVFRRFVCHRAGLPRRQGKIANRQLRISPRVQCKAGADVFESTDGRIFVRYRSVLGRCGLR
jgi:hypothetical protein